MLSVEDVLAQLAGRGMWPDTGRTDKTDARFRHFTGVLDEIASHMFVIRASHFTALNEYGRAAIIREARERKHLTRSALAEKIGIGTGDLALMEQGQAAEISDDRVRLIMNVLDIPGAPYKTLAAETAKGSQTRNAKQGDQVADLLADTITGMPRVEWLTILWIVESDAGAYSKLHARLIGVISASQKHDKSWPKQVRRSPCHCGRAANPDYRPDLAHLALLEIRAPGLFESHVARAEWFGLSERHWRGAMARPYGILQAKTFTWFGSGCSYIARRLRRRRRRMPGKEIRD